MIDLLKFRPLGVPAAEFFRRVGAEEISRKISPLCGYVPRVVEVYIQNDRTRPPCFRMESDGGRDSVARTLWWGGWAAFERPLPDLFLAFSRECRFVLDVGAYSGFYSMIAVSCPEVEKCYAFEPLPEARARLEQNVALNRLDGRIDVVASAVADRTGVADFYVPTTKTGLIESSSSLNPYFHAEHLCTIKVPLLTLDEFSVQSKCRPVGLMKIDVESQEHRVLLGMGSILREDRPVIFLEILSKADCRELESLRAEFQYASGLLQPDGILWRDRVAYAHNHNDQFLCPVEKVDRFNEVVRSIGYHVG